MPEMPKTSATPSHWSQYWTQSIYEQARKRHALETRDPAYLFEQNPEVFASQGCAKGVVGDIIAEEEPRGDCPEIPLFFGETAGERA